MSELKRPPRQRPGLESLEDRSVPASFSHLASLFGVQPAPAPAPAAPAQAAPAQAAQPSLGQFTNTGTGQGPVYSLGANGTTATPTTTSSTPVPLATATPGTVAQPQTSTEATFTSALVGQSRTGTIQKFNSSLGTLTRVEIIAEGAMSADAAVENLGPGAGTVKAELHGSMSFQVAGMANSVAATLTKAESGAVTAFDGTADLAGTSARSFGLEANASFQTVTISDSASLALFSGTGTLQVVQQATADTCVCGPGNLMGAVETEASGKIRVVYHYTPTAELGSIAGYVYHDVNKNGAYNSRDRMLSGVSISLTGTDVYGAAVTRTAVTAANGWFTFGGLTAGTYTLTETQPATYAQGTNRVGTAGGTVIGDTIASINLEGGARATNYGFGEIRDTPTPIRNPPPTTPWTPSTVKSRFGGRFGWL